MTVAQPASHAALAEHVIANLGAVVFETVAFPPRLARHAEAPDRYRSGAAGKWLTNFLTPGERPYLHQSLALAELERGSNVVISTATASGKSLCFIAPAVAEMLEGDGTVLVFYPLKALGADQRHAWERELARAGLPLDLVGEVTGDVPMTEREQVLQDSRIILATPDVINAWMMPMAASPLARQFLARLALVVIDEAHSLEAVFGSQFALFFRRLRAAHRRAQRA